MKKITLRQEKEFALKEFIWPKRYIRSISKRSLVSKFNNQKKPLFLGEIHDCATYNGTGYSISLKKICEEYDRYCDAIVIATDDTIFKGSPRQLFTARKITTKPLVALDIFLYPEQIMQSAHYGADAVILIGSILTAKETAKNHRYAI